MTDTSKIGQSNLNQIGGKAQGLLNLQACGLTLPHFVIIDFDTISSWNNDRTECQSWIDENFNALDTNKLWAVRSSSANEDSKEQSFAGQFKTVLNVAFTDLSETIMEVISSYAESNVYGTETPHFGVIIQEMIDSEYSGVLFSKHPVDYTKHHPLVNLIPGLGDKLVSGELEGMQVELKENELVYHDLKECYHGVSVKAGKETRIEKSVGDLKDIISKFSDLFKAGLYKLEQYLKCPVDVEIAIAGDNLFWLQVRPMVNRSLKENIIIWDKTQAEGNYGGITLPLTVSHVQKTYGSVYVKGSEMIGYSPRILNQNKADMHRIVDSIHGRLYYNLNAWQGNLYQMPFGKKLVQLLPKIWNMEAVDFKAPPLRHNFLERVNIFFQLLIKLIRSKKYNALFDDAYEAALKQYNPKDFHQLSLENQLTIYQSMMDKMGKSAFAAISNGFYTMISFFLLKSGLKGSKIITDHPNFINDVLRAEGEVTSVQLLHSYEELVNIILDDEQLKELFKTKEVSDIWKELTQKYLELDEKIKEYIRLYGDRTKSSELKMETTTFKQDPLLFIELLQESIRISVVSTEQKRKESPTDYRSILKAYYPINFLWRLFLVNRVKGLIFRFKSRENFRYKRTRIFSIFRDMFLSMGNNLVELGYLNTQKDIFYLTVDELFTENLREGYNKL
ncbi:PEP/pyruvate-binding domain-containing protein, partial [Lishizhenia sp.]|uniref:PEP/pyruvate-binding domain-containing protein n=1 Tax=Lishizhenia sp. TaxID=2497594 RepID=UPI00299E5376